MTKLYARITFAVVLLAAVNARGISQTTIPDVLLNGTIQEQMTYLNEKTRIYQDYRAIREDMFQLIRKNSVDSMAKVQGQVLMLAGMNRNLVSRIDSLTASLTGTQAQLDEAVSTKNSIKIIGLNVNKVTYNSLMWIIVGSLLALLSIGFLVFRRNIYVTGNTKKELDELRTEFEAYRQKARLDREKMSMDHFNEIRKLRGG